MKQAADLFTGGEQRQASIASDRDKILEALRLFCGRKDIIEVRALNVGGRNNNVVSGFFDYEHLPAAADQIDSKRWFTSASGVYLVLNEINPACLALAANHFKEYAKHTTSDGSIFRRRWLLIDFDPKRPAGVSSTDAEKEHAKTTAQSCMDFLGGQGWPTPVFADSGNGYHLLYPINLPNNDLSTQLIKNVLASLAAKFSDEHVDVDRSVFNAGRICKLYGTVAAKGDDIADRPHRLSRILTLPKKSRATVTRTQLKSLANQIEPDDKHRATTISPSTAEITDLAALTAWLETHEVPVGPRRDDKDGGWKWNYKRDVVCPFSDQHDASSVCVGWNSQGNPWAKCHHASCAGKNWHDLRPKYEAGYQRSGRAPNFFEENGCICITRKKSDGTPYTTELTNFTARITADVNRDDGSGETHRYFKLTAKCGERQVHFEVPTTEFTSPKKWALAHLGAAATITPGRDISDYVGYAIQGLSASHDRKVIYTHTGWRTIGEEHFFLHAGGALGAEGPAPTVDVDLPLPLQTLSLTTTQTPDRSTIASALKLLDLAPLRITAPLWAAAFLAPLPIAKNMTVALVGPSGAFKSTLAALLTNFFAPKITDQNLPLNYFSTANFNETVLFAAKDVPMVVDDFAPDGTRSDQQRAEHTAARLERAQGNQSGRGRLRSDTSINAPRPPRGLMITTGEVTVPGLSIAARKYTIEIAKGDVNDLETLTEFQKFAWAGNLVAITADYIKWIARNHNSLKEGLQTELAARRTSLLRDHPRQASNAALLWLGWWAFLQYGADSKLLEKRRVSSLEKTAWATLSSDDTQRHMLLEQDQARIFGRLINSLLATRDAWLGPVGLFGVQNKDLPDKGDNIIGWEDKATGDIYLDPSTAYAAARKLGPDQLTINLSGLKRLLDAGGWLVETGRDGESRDTLCIRRTIAGRRVSVLWITRELIEPNEVLDASKSAVAAGPKKSLTQLRGAVT